MTEHTTKTLAQRREAQKGMEQLGVEEGIARYRRALEERGDSALPPGLMLTKAAMDPMRAAVTQWVEDVLSGGARKGVGAVHFINQFAPEVTAFITGQVIINSMSGKNPPLARAAVSIASQLEAHISIDAIAARNPKLAARVAKNVEGMNSDQRRLVFIRKGAEFADVKVIQWDPNTRLRVGTTLVHIFCEATGLATISTVPDKGNKTVQVIRPTEACRKWLEGAHEHCELMSPVRLPMVCPPLEWRTPFSGGYLSKQIRQPLVKTRNRGYLTSLKTWSMPWVYEAINTMQGTCWAINEPIYDVIRTLWEADSELGGLPRRNLHDIPAKPWEEGTEPDPEVLKVWKRSAAVAYEENARLDSKRVQTVQKLWTAERMIEAGNEFWYVYNLDWRGRMYPVGNLTPQGDDVSKALLHFANAEPLGDTGGYWLAVHTANTFGVDKVPFAERLEWFTENYDMILRCAEDPYLWREWTKADSPFCFLAACKEMAGMQAWVDAGNPQEEYRSRIAVAFDGSCNGLQNFSAMLRDPVGGAATGLIPAHKPADIYSAVAREAEALIERDAARVDGEMFGKYNVTRASIAREWVGKMTRKLAKRNTMTVPYGVTQSGMRTQLFDELSGVDMALRLASAAYLAECNFEAIGRVVIAARSAMDWLREAAKVAASSRIPVQWVTPTGFLVLQDYRDQVGNEVDFAVMGKRYRLLLTTDGDSLNARKQALGISPNYVHSLDAAHLMRTVLLSSDLGITDFAMIHDSYGCHAAQAGVLRDCLREAFVQQYSGNVLEDFRNQLLEDLPPEVAKELPPLPPMGDLDISQVRESDYFFA